MQTAANPCHGSTQKKMPLFFSVSIARNVTPQNRPEAIFSGWRGGRVEWDWGRFSSTDWIAEKAVAEDASTITQGGSQRSEELGQRSKHSMHIGRGMDKQRRGDWWDMALLEGQTT